MKLSSLPEEPLSLRKRAASVKNRIGPSATATRTNLSTQAELSTNQPSPKQVKLESEADAPPPIPEVKVEEQSVDQKTDDEGTGMYAFGRSSNDCSLTLLVQILLQSV